MFLDLLTITSSPVGWPVSISIVRDKFVQYFSTVYLESRQKKKPLFQNWKDMYGGGGGLQQSTLLNLPSFIRFPQFVCIIY